MDGYALRFGGTNEFKIIGEIQAGDDASNYSLNQGEAIKIFTGAMCPKSADAVCRIEDIDEGKQTINVTVMPKSGANIRLTSEQIKAGEVGLPKGQSLNPAAIGFLANLGVQEVKVCEKPRISLISTGNELVSPGEFDKLPPGKIYESNAIMLQAAVLKSGFNTNPAIHLEDTYEATFEGIKEKLETSDVLIISGGISVGDYDFVGKALLENGVQQVFYKINQKPGKPLFFGRKGNKLVFALPGNPAAALTCFYVYVLPALRKLAGSGFNELIRTKAKLTNQPKQNAREQFLKAQLEGETVTILDGQSSAMLKTFAEANALIHLKANEVISEGDDVTVIRLP